MRMKCTISYDGHLFYGYQVQPGQRTIQDELEKALQTLHKAKERIPVVSSGRTDSGVHAVGQTIHFDSPLSIPEAKWPYALNALLPDDISVRKAEAVNDQFHARFSAKRKEYRYMIYRGRHPDVFKRYYAYHVPYDLDMEKVKEASRYLVGTHDFTSFCATKTEVKDKVRTVHELEWSDTGDGLQMRIVGSGFLYNMVRIIAGTLLDVGTGKFSPGDIEKMILAKNRDAAGRTAPAHGLYLWRVIYDN
ncbi:tRNA pseudouridine(38-40) synthase TruA [Bacillus licheniformis]|uniref:tRNA pseudouridine synthase A n=1 Tax=Bacillus licheniformis (strain ATCC 14580 / DSM 13 / JCM 2505 / CCUG 7422 / NBRC 12200 / NCIMB 9375 / NCTC 10341 / NRRL NRS-1264 / Gibson 46) TaxID=279010 RepID=TRUA_BACLD|nr:MULTISPECIES: tRNA pseudouridine(38-40) synthase TruA [Bacillus]Q65P74.1 RecName: Full=tRNA pseudouridine synthase A; AltName: Full=tRNA pseudouridine(38-40) synthase; AltName: Full=tRNA pseudouridylate synthase I; AltName: Full=tRNA-uridine isomerase I [Bacillus licheniformis DSM 13 = ATCC 14580]MBY8348817.1 tRNA pseudouridine(38-40) synthase TruA [Bacillus sp. PCH94]AAU21795.1 pseudouridylate synthase I [Bacillus licheniformis DSM 13 = ATCC 14580]AAU39140.1 tRNA pseudouridine synthase TruA